MWETEQGMEMRKKTEIREDEEEGDGEEEKKARGGNFAEALLHECQQDKYLPRSERP